jgi:hypothetical protein
MVKRSQKYNWKEREFIFTMRKVKNDFANMLYADLHQSEYTFGLQGLTAVVTSSTIYGRGDSRDRPVNAL